MGKNIKRLSLALLALGLSAPAFADTCNPFQVTVPNQAGGFTIGADALYLQPSVSYGTFNNTVGNPVTVVSGLTTTTTINASTNSVDPDYHWGFDITAAYRICGTGNDISATWTHLGQHSDSDTLSFPGLVFADGIPIPPVGDPIITLPAGTYNLAVQGSLNFDYDAVDVDVGQRVNFGDYFQYRVFAGVRWAQLEADKTVANTLTQTGLAVGVSPASLLERVDQNSKFDGFGPQVGLDGRYCIGYGFGLDANLTASMLIGRTDSDSHATIIAGAPASTVATAFTLITNQDSSTKDRVVPAIDASLGLDYTFNFNNCDRSSLVVQAGWKVINYFDVAHHANFDDQTVSPAFTTGGSFFGSNTGHNVAFQGPYAGVKVNL